MKMVELLPLNVCLFTSTIVDKFMGTNSHNGVDYHNNLLLK